MDKNVKPVVQPAFDGMVQMGVIVKGSINYQFYVDEEIKNGNKVRDCGDYIEIYGKIKNK